MKTILAEPDRRRTARRPHRGASRTWPKVPLFGKEVDLVRPEEMLDLIAERVNAGQPALVSSVGLRDVLRLGKKKSLDSLNRLSDVRVASSPVLSAMLWAPRYAGAPFPAASYRNWRGHFWSLAHRESWRVLYIGDQGPALDRTIEALRTRYKGLMLGLGSEADQSVDGMVAFEPDIILLGFDRKLQARWFRRHGSRFSSVAISLDEALETLEP